MPVSRNDVLLAYRYILGRNPENLEVVEQHLRDHTDFEALRRAFLTSGELSQQLGRPVAPSGPSPAVLPLEVDPIEVETVTDAATLNHLIEETARFWEAIGETAPHFSVVTAPEFRPDQISANEGLFFESAEVDKRLLLAVLRRAGRHPDDFSSLVEFGCGVGRMTALFAPLFREVIGLDISRPHLTLAEQTMARFGIRNARFIHVTAADLHPVSNFDLWFSRIVLQHNPPPVVLHILDKMFQGLAPGGLTVFQVPTYHVGYRFHISEYLAADLGTRMEMHAVPQRAIFDLARRHGCNLIEIREDGAVGINAEWLSNTFVFEKT
jgi:SAM-dependent methyltransferase